MIVSETDDTCFRHEVVVTGLLFVSRTEVVTKIVHVRKTIFASGIKGHGT